MAGEDTATSYAEALVSAPEPWTSAMAAWEATIVLARPGQLNCSFRSAMGAVLRWLDERGIALREAGPPREILTLAISVAEKHGVGKRALSNLDCFHYAYAKATGAPLLTLDVRLRATDIETLPRAGVP